MYKKQEMEESNSDVLGGGHGMKLQSFKAFCLFLKIW